MSSSLNIFTIPNFYLIYGFSDVEDYRCCFQDEYLLQYIRDLFEAGTETTSSTLSWCILAFLHYPECQEKIYAEIEDVIGECVWYVYILSKL